MQLYFLSCCSSVTFMFPEWPGYFSIPFPQTQQQDPSNTADTIRLQKGTCMYVLGVGEGAEVGDQRRRLRGKRGEKIPLQLITCSAVLEQDKKSKPVFPCQWQPSPCTARFHIHRVIFIPNILSMWFGHKHTSFLRRIMPTPPPSVSPYPNLCSTYLSFSISPPQILTLYYSSIIKMCRSNNIKWTWLCLHNH